MQTKIKKKIIVAITSFAMSFSMLCSGIQLPFGITDNSTAYAATISDMPSEYQYAADWIWENRIVAENSTGSSPARWNLLFDQIIDGKGTLNYVVRWHSTKTITLEQRQALEGILDDAVNQWGKLLVGYENWPYEHIDVNIVGWAVTDSSRLLDLQSDEIVYTDTSEYVIQSGESSAIPTTMANAPSELSRFDHFADENYQYPGGLEKRFDMYLWATEGFPNVGGCGGDWGQRLSDTAYLNMLNGSNMFVQVHELGHAFGITDFYGAEGASDGFPPGGFPGGGTSIMMAGSSATITDFDGWLLRYMWSKIKDETGRFDLANAQSDTSDTSDSSTPEDTKQDDAKQDDSNQNTTDDSNNSVEEGTDVNKDNSIIDEQQQNTENTSNTDNAEITDNAENTENTDNSVINDELDNIPKTADKAVIGIIVVLFIISGTVLFRRYTRKINCTNFY